MSAQAENPGKVKFSYKKYYSFRNRINTPFGGRVHADMCIENVTRVLFYGDTQPALVMSVSPLTVAAYSDEIDGVLMLRFPDQFVEKYGLYPGMRLTTSNVYFRWEQFPDDILVGENFCRRYNDFLPIVQLFIGKGDEKIKAKTALFSEEVWNRVSETAARYAEKHPDTYRDGFFYFKK